MTPREKRLEKALRDLIAAADNMGSAVNSGLADEAIAEAEKVLAEKETLESLDARMEAAGMIPASKILSGDLPIARFMTHAGVVDFESYGSWLKMKSEEYLRMKVSYELKDAEKDDLTEWIGAHWASFHEALLNFEKARAGEKST